MSARMTAPSYKVAAIETLAATPEMQARVFTLAPGEEIPWHFHTAVADWYVGMEGTVVVETRAPRAEHRLGPGALATVPAKTAHHVVNPGPDPCRFLLLQGIGAYDFNPLGGQPAGSPPAAERA
jgi:quercetin dioxygenase-like cupin family protein